MLWFILALVFVVVVGNALLLLRTAKKPVIPASLKPYQEGEEEGW